MRIRSATARETRINPLLSRLARIFAAGAALVTMLMSAGAAMAQESAGGEANLKLPDLSQVRFVGGIDGHSLLLWGTL